ncbi:MAG: leucine-rich repeat protein [Erysipelotrichaceae bacterium]|nr:leucine-rich repeat protein [Erysipelotrichaceae bacterium]
MNGKKTVNWLLSFMMAFSTMLSDVTVYAEGEEETAEPVIEEVAEIEETVEPEVTEIVVEEEEATEGTEIIENSDYENELTNNEETGDSEKPEGSAADYEEIDSETQDDQDENNESIDDLEAESEENDSEDELSSNEGSDDTINAAEEDDEEAELSAETPSSSFQYTISNKKVTITRFIGSEKVVVIPSKINGYPVTGLAFDAFWYSQTITSVTIPEGITELPDGFYPIQTEGVFCFCENLAEVNLPDTLKAIGDCSFVGCKSLKEILIPDSVTRIGEYAFSNCDSLEKITIPANVNTIEDHPFFNCDELTAIDVDPGNRWYKSINGILYDYDLTTLICAPNKSGFHLYEGIQKIGIDAFSCCDELRDIVIPEGVTEIDDSSFYFCRQLSSIVLPESLKRIGNYAFYNCSSLSFISIPGNVNYIGDNVFFWCDNLTDIFFAGTKEKWNKLVNDAGRLGLSDTVNVYFDNQRIDYVYGLVYQIIENEYKPEGPHGPIEILQSVTVKKYIGENDFIIIPDTIVGIPVTKIDDGAFRDLDITGVELPDQLEEIGNEAFALCADLKSVSIPGTVRQIGDFAFYCNQKLDNVKLAEGIQHIGSYAFFGCRSLETLDLPSSLESFGESAFSESFIESVSLPDQITEIPDSAFKNCSNLQHITIPQSVVRIGKSAFNSCGKLQDIELPDFISSIGDYAFAGSGIDMIQISSSCKSIGLKAFLNCTELQWLVIPDIVFSANIFEGCDSLMFILYQGNEAKLKKINGVEYDTITERYFLNIAGSSIQRTVPIFPDHRLDIINGSGPLFVIGKDNWAFGHSAGYQGVNNHLLLEKHYNDLIQHLNRSEIADLQVKMNSEWHGSCSGLSMTMALLGNRILSLSDIPQGGGKPDLFDIDVLPSDNEELRSYIEYYYLSRAFTSTSTRLTSYYNEWADNTDNTELLFTKMFALMDQGSWVVFDYFYWTNILKIESSGHAVVASAYDRMNEAYLNAIREKGIIESDILDNYFRDGYIVQIYNVNNKDDLEYILVSEDLKKFYYLNSQIISNIAETNSLVLSIGYVDPRGVFIYGKGAGEKQEITGRKICFEDQHNVRIVSSTGKYLEYINGVLKGSIPWSDLRASTDDVTESISELSVAVDDTGDWTVISLDGKEIAMNVYDSDRFMQVSASNADQVNLSLSSGTMNITGTDVIFDVHMTTAEEVLPGQLGHGSVSGKGSGTINFSTSGSSVLAESTGKMNDVISTAYVGAEREYSEKENNVTRVTADTRGYLNIGNKQIQVAIGESEKIEITAFPAGMNEDNITFESTDPAVCTVDEKGNVTGVGRGSASIRILHNGNELQYCTITVSESGIYAMVSSPELLYSGEAIKPRPIVYDGVKLLDEKTDYTVTYKNNVKAYELEEGDNGFDKKKAPQVIIHAKNSNYQKSVTVYFTIKAAELSGIGGTIKTAYTGKVQKLNPEVFYKDKKLKKGTDYTLSYPSEGDYKSPGNYEIIVNGKGNYKGSKVYTLQISEEGLYNIAKAKIAAIPDQEYTGQYPELSLNVTAGGKTLVQGEDYTVSYLNWENAGTATAVIEGNGLTAVGKKMVSFKIKGTPIKDVITLTAVKSIEYTGKENYGAVTITPKNEEVDSNWYKVIYGNITEVGKATVTVKGIKGYTGSITKTFNITARKFNTENYEILADDSVMLKNGARPEVTVKDNVLGKTLVRDVDYTVSYANNKAVTTEKTKKSPTVIIKGKGNYSGTLKTTFAITPQRLSKLAIYANSIQESTKAGAYTTTLIITDTDGGVLKANTDYDLKNAQYYIDGERLDKTYIPKAGDVITVKVKGKGNYTGIGQAQFTVLPKDTNIAKASFKIKNKEYTGKAVTLTAEDFISAKLGKETLVYGEDYEICSISNNINKGKAAVVLKGIGEYGGYKRATFNIGQRSFLDWWNGILFWTEIHFIDFNLLN